MQGATVGPGGQTRGYMSFAAEPVTIAAGSRSIVELHLVVAEGYHVNSHTPKSELLVPTAATLTPDAGLSVGAVEYPAGVSFRFPADPTETLEVYTGPITLKLPIIASAGAHTLRGTVRYQACDQRACYPPKTLTIAVELTAK